MTLEQLISLTQRYCKLGGYADAQPSPDFAGAVNEAYREVSTETEYNWEDVNLPSVVGQAEYDLTSAAGISVTSTRDWIRITDVLWGTNSWIDQIDEVRLRKYDLLWTQAPNGVPAYWWISRPNVLRLYPPPDSVTTMYLHGSREVGPLAAGASPTFPVRYHDCIPLRAAWNLLKDVATGSGYQRAVAFNAEADKKIGKFKGMLQDQKTVVFTREVERPRPERLKLGVRSSVVVR